LIIIFQGKEDYSYVIINKTEYKKLMDLQ